MFGTRGARRRAPAARFAVLALLSCVALCAPGAAHAELRFGDSTWVAPGASFASGYATSGPRVVPPDQERGWESALRAPFRIVFFPLRLAAHGLEAGAGLVGRRFLEPKAQVAPKPGPSLGASVSLGGLNDIGLGPAVTWVGFPTDDARLRLSGTWSTLDRRRAQFTGVIGDRRPVGFRLGAEYDYKPNRRYFGIGNETPETDLSYFLLEKTSAEASLLIGASPLRQVRISGGYSSMSPRRGYRGQPLLEDVFTPASAPFAHLATRSLWYGLSTDLAALDDSRDPSRGVHARVDLRRAAGMRSGDPGYYQWRAEGRAYLPVFAKRRVIAVRGVYAGVDPTAGATTALPYYRLAQSDGTTRFAGYASERFRDRQLLLARIEYRWLIVDRMSAVALYELGEVAPRMSSFTLRAAHTSYGGGLRLGMSDESTVRFEVAKSVEGLKVVLALGGDF